ncbi:hypothetical protein GCM10018790_38980 [Kitasatospora xanthocidica]|nr:hypothetical protein GCM10018790_38980 [Kitasatospora xanthocidica]
MPVAPITLDLSRWQGRSPGSLPGPDARDQSPGARAGGNDRVPKGQPAGGGSPPTGHGASCGGRFRATPVSGRYSRRAPQIRPRRMAYPTACARLRRPSLVMISCSTFLTVRSE